ncbi:GyrI-like domain-containing protein [Brachybacterium sp.]|uniref:GyrI-like domain-containing protein n=1 Tax=Brachybacterium sp. TaxID=1891286 RepID=UPI002ED1C849
MITIPPTLVQRAPTPYAALAASVTMAELDTVIPAALDEVAARLAARGIAPIGPPLIRYRVIDMDGLLQIENGWPVADLAGAPDSLVLDTLPGGTYGSATYRDVREGVAGNAALLDWGREQGHMWDRWDTPEGDAFASRIELFLTGPEEDPDPATWLNEVAIKVVG